MLHSLLKETSLPGPAPKTKTVEQDLFDHAGVRNLDDSTMRRLARAHMQAAGRAESAERHFENITRHVVVCRASLLENVAIHLVVFKSLQ